MTQEICYCLKYVADFPTLAHMCLQPGEDQQLTLKFFPPLTALTSPMYLDLFRHMIACEKNKFSSAVLTWNEISGKLVFCYRSAMQYKRDHLIGKI